MGESYLPHSVLHEKVLTLRKLFVHLVHRPKVKSQESYRPDKTQGLCDPWSGGWALLRTFPTAVRHHRLRQSQTRIQSITSLTRSQGGADGRDGALWRDVTVYASRKRSTQICRCTGCAPTDFLFIATIAGLIRNEIDQDKRQITV